jgi:crotonobetainyl-CoA:carnitine CoA-transferase CaiB-like acyl-CoA transferase
LLSDVPRGDGQWLAVGALELKFWAALCGKLGCPEFIADNLPKASGDQIMNLQKIFHQRVK